MQEMPRKIFFHRVLNRGRRACPACFYSLAGSFEVLQTSKPLTQVAFLHRPLRGFSRRQSRRIRRRNHTGKMHKKRNLFLGNFLILRRIFPFCKKNPENPLTNPLPWCNIMPCRAKMPQIQSICGIFLYICRFDFYYKMKGNESL